MTFLIAVVMLGLIIFVHELGHFLTAKLFKMPVSEFSIGMGPQVFSVDTKNTAYSFRAIPIGGYVNIEGMEIGSEVENGFSSKPAYQRFIVLFAGVFMNFLMAFILLFVTAKISGKIEYDTNAIIGGLVKGGANEQILKVEDKILELDGKKINVWTDISKVTKASQNKEEIPALIERNGKEENLTLKLTKDEENNRVVLGISPKYKKVDLSTTESLDFAKNSFNSIFTDTIKGFFTLFSGKASLKEISGPVGIFKVVGEVSKFGWVSIASLCVVLSINIGVLNLLPIPALDGGRIIFVLLELIGIKINKKWEEKLHKGGMILLLFFILMISVNDVWKLFN
ncbi:RIP metalloprotease RseP [Fusobacterium vincentii 3_1_36A2]|uniref:Site-2 protease family protein n=3 Tax=Fusobacterium vincentii TaxID=155615 RepID=A0AAJ1CRG6_FUSVC|nr:MULTISPECIES: M50 family metallopeptidase [Fusobacterium]EEU32708.1 RIP metalloprotease RseP [Fusobacterium vincentii 3_1_36A2]EFG34193.1 RIP metalloprotease RseP [Fusobacterium vincentii 3_1_27]EMP16586.1 membrane metalloprotease [Fusobacterium nucleatum CC53]ERT45062.1 RIP metalloprotease RseP [Fusobacterium nucleatum CTI-7]MCW0262889.1 site-2 protease family protein [Fusobacterium vincentii]